MKKKLAALALVVVMVAMLFTGLTMAYFTDSDSATNTFTLGNVEIDLHESNKDGDKDDAYQAWLKNQTVIPGKANALDKIVSIENTGDQEAWVWYTVAYPMALDSITYTNEEGKTVTRPILISQFDVAGQDNWIVNGEDEDYFGTYEENGVTYGYYTCLYKEKLAASETADKGLVGVWLKEHVEYFESNDNGLYLAVDGHKIDYNFINGYNVVITAYAIQDNNFADVTEAFENFGKY